MPGKHRSFLAGLFLGAGFFLPSGMASAEDNPAAAMGTAFLPVAAGTLRLEGGSAVAVPGGASAGKGFVRIVNQGDTPDRIVSISSPSSRETRLYRQPTNGEPERVENLEIPARGTVEMRSDGLYIDFRNVVRPFEAGGEVAVTLNFEKAGAVGLRLPVTASR